MSNPFETYEAQKDETTLEGMIRLAEEISDLERMKGDLEDELKDINGRLNTLKSQEIPEMFAELGISEFKLQDGTSLKVHDVVAGSLPKDEKRRNEALRWLEDNEASDLIKTNVSMAFSKNEHNMALDLVARLRDEGYEVDCNSGVHAQTLAAFARERLANGDELPLELLGLYVGKTTKVKR